MSKHINFTGAELTVLSVVILALTKSWLLPEIFPIIQIQQKGLLNKLTFHTQQHIRTALMLYALLSAILEHLYLFVYKCKIQIQNGKWGQAENHTGPDNPSKGLNLPCKETCQHNEFRLQGHHRNEQDLMAQFV